LILAATLLPLSAFSHKIEEKSLLDIKENVVTCQSVDIQQSGRADVSLGQQVVEYFSSLFKTDSWPPRWYCGRWSTFHGWFYIGSDFLIWLSYFTIPAILFFFLYKKKENIPFRGVFVFFIGFILLCGLTHLIDVVIFWWPAYRLSALIRFGTALVSMGTVFALVKVIPKALELKSPDVLERLVEKRTEELLRLNTRYQEEILERKNAENEVKRLNRALNDFRQAITDCSIISITDKKGIINYVNDNFVQISGYGEKELLGKNHRIINSGHHDKAFWINMWQKISKGQTWRAEVKNKAKNGSYYWVDMFIMPFRDESGKINQYLSIRNDITERKNAEEELKELNNTLELRVEEKIRDIKSYNERLMKVNELFESVQTHSHIGIWEYDVVNNQLYFSDEAYRVFKFPEDHKISLKDIFNSVHQNFKRKLLSAVGHCVKQGKKYDIELLIDTYDDVELWVRVTGFPEYSDDKIIKIKGMIKNIDGWKRSEIELRESKAHLAETNEELESFTYSVSHDLRAPLRYIHGHARILEEDYLNKLDSDGKEVLQVITNNTRKMGQLIDDLLHFSRLGRREMNSKECDMKGIVQNLIIDELKQELNHADVHVDIKKIHPARADFNMIRQVWINLISNAIKYSGKKDQAYIEIGSYKHENEIVYYVKDNGVGFDPTYKHKLFGVFQRLHRIEDFDGTGVGLAIVHRIITRHHGRVWAEAEIDAGAKFYFTLPK